MCGCLAVLHGTDLEGEDEARGDVGEGELAREPAVLLHLELVDGEARAPVLVLARDLFYLGFLWERREGLGVYL